MTLKLFLFKIFKALNICQILANFLILALARSFYGSVVWTLNLVQCSISGSRTSVGKVRVFRREQPVNGQQSEAEDDQHTQVCGLEIENISSTVFIL